jgi:integrase
MTSRELTERAIKDTQPGDVLRDRIVPGLHLRAFPQSKAFYLYFRTKAGVQRKPKLGEHGAITLVQARAVAREMLVEVAAGRDPSQKRQDDRAELSVEDLWNEYWKRHGSKKKSSVDDKGLWNRYLKSRFSRQKLSAVGYKQVADMMDALKATPIAANRALALLSKMFNFAHRPLQLVVQNPCKGVARYPENKRRRYMKGDEPAKIATLLDAVADKEPAGVAFIYLLILTGARCGEIAAARWTWLHGNALHLPDSKTGEKQVYLPPQAMDVIGRLKRTNGTIVGIKSPKKLWDRVRREAGCPDLRLHDLRHSFASAAISAGFSLAQIGELLGHKNTQTTQRYAHLVEEAALAASTATADVLFAAMKKTPAAA